MTTTEDLETQINYIVNRYKDIDKEREEKINKYKKWTNDVSRYAPFIAASLLVVFLLGMVYSTCRLF